jgi:hypothetical protein
MDIIRTGKKGKHVNILKKYFVYKVCKDKLYENDTYNPLISDIARTTLQIAAHASAQSYISRGKHTKTENTSDIRSTTTAGERIEMGLVSKESEITYMTREYINNTSLHVADNCVNHIEIHRATHKNTYVIITTNTTFRE